MSLLEINDLTTVYHTDRGVVHGVDGVSLSLSANETLGLVGESGSGKTTLARSINRILPKNAEIVEGEIIYDGTDLTALSERELRRYRWNDIAMVPQSSMNALDPVYTVQRQIVEVIRQHRDVSKAAARTRARELLELVGIDPERGQDYPHQFSGGMKQRAMIALALALDPKVLLADEPTTALDVIIQNKILSTIESLQEELDLAMILITHDISVVSDVSDTMAVFYGGKVAEYGETRQIIKAPSHPYTMGLRNSFPSILQSNADLVSIPGQPPNLIDPVDECRFVDRCPFAEDECRERHPAARDLGGGHLVECHRADEDDAMREAAADRTTWLEVDDVRNPTTR